MRFFIKELVSNPLKFQSGSFAPFEHLGDDTGGLATEDGYFISQLELAIQRHTGGISEVDHDSYQDLKKKLEGQPLRKSSNNSGLPHLLFQPPSTRPQNAVVAAEEVKIPPSLEVPVAFTKPRIGRPPGSKNKI